MSTKFRTINAVAGFVCFAAAAAGCTSTVAGTASPAPTTAPTASADVFNGLNACRLLDQLNAGQGFNPGENKSARNQCVAVKPGWGSFALALDPEQGLSEFATANTGVVNSSINGRRAMQAQTTTGGCAIALEVTEHARVLVIATLSDTADGIRACPDARTFADKVEPLLPAG
ncbi:hypothetical protein [Amycolatopsis sp. ATCC 39116]|uniref:hypothetical protein n=1 Tax=Amycolatopsis sp. (strain ATCC 39116 / 75iv2) TaxID=385957 RepID=UPI00026285E0|nr:hypothetical protein [Amycolatopsis sp. ATCC 39116]